MLDARHLNSNTGQLSESRPLDPLATRLARANNKSKAAINLLYYAYTHATLDDEAINIPVVSSGDKILLY